MRLRRYCRRIRNSAREASDTELNLVPMLDMFLSLIPFLLVSAAFLNYGGILVEAPAFAAVTQSAPPHSDRSINLAVNVSDSRMTIAAYTQDFLSPLSAVNGTMLNGDFSVSDLAAIDKHLALLKHNHKVASILFHVEPRVRYQTAVTVLNSLKKSNLSEHIVLAVRNMP